MKQCPKCLYTPADESQFCARCGKKLKVLDLAEEIAQGESVELLDVKQTADESQLDKKTRRKIKRKRKKFEKKAKKLAKKALYRAKPIPTRLSASALIAFIFAFYALLNWLNPLSILIAYAAIFIAIIGIFRTRRGKYSGRSLAVASFILSMFLFVAQFLTLAAVAYMINLPAVTNLVATVGNVINGVGNLFEQLTNVLTELQKVLPIITDAASAMKELAGVVHSLGVVLNLIVEILTKIQKLLLFIPFL